jgi:uncharacterized membrane protein YbhN (UPF0104 family)
MQKTLHKITPLISVCLLIAAGWFLYKETQKTTLEAVIEQIRAIPGRRIVLALVLVVANYAVLSMFDTLAFLYIKYPISFRRTLLMGFLCHAFGNSIGSTLVTGGSMRLRFYTTWGLSVIDIGKVVIFCGLTFWIGLAAVGGVAFIVDPLPLPDLSYLPLSNVRPIGVAMLGILAAYILLSFFYRGSFKIKDKKIDFPSGPVAVFQMLAGAMDLLTISGVFYAVLPVAQHMPDLTYPAFVGYFMVAFMIATSSLIPGGLGIFDYIMIWFLGRHTTQAHAILLGALIVYRTLYFLLPLCAGMVTLVWAEHHYHISRKKILPGAPPPSASGVKGSPPA